jgi:ABC-2 type transport system ATP-binding protein
MDFALEFDGINKEYRSWLGGNPVQALQDFSLGVERGEIFGFLGPNGAGKTTAIHVAMGFVRASSGSGRMLGKPFGHAQTRGRVGFLAEVVAFCSTSTARAVRFYGGLSGLRGPELELATGKALALVNLQPESTRNVNQLSRGMLQRLGLAQALVNDPELLILDEPTSALDPAARVAVRELLLKLRDQGKTIFLSSHLLSEIELVCDRIGVVHRGRLVRVGKLADLLRVEDQVEIVASGLGPDLLVGATMQGAFALVRVAREEQRTMIERIWSAGGEVVSVNPIRRSLEELFLELTAESPDQAIAPSAIGYEPREFKG